MPGTPMGYVHPVRRSSSCGSSAWGLPRSKTIGARRVLPAHLHGARFTTRRPLSPQRKRCIERGDTSPGLGVPYNTCRRGSSTARVAVPRPPCATCEVSTSFAACCCAPLRVWILRSSHLPISRDGSVPGIRPSRGFPHHDSVHSHARAPPGLCPGLACEAGCAMGGSSGVCHRGGSVSSSSQAEACVFDDRSLPGFRGSPERATHRTDAHFSNSWGLPPHPCVG